MLHFFFLKASLELFFDHTKVRTEDRIINLQPIFKWLSPAVDGSQLGSPECRVGIRIFDLREIFVIVLKIQCVIDLSRAQHSTHLL